MFNDYYLLKRIEEDKGDLSFASAMDSFTYKGEIVKTPHDYVSSTNVISGPQIGDKVLFLKGSGEDTPDGFKAVKLEDMIMKL